MKRHGNLFAAAVSRKALYQAYYDARKNKVPTYACFEFEKSLAHQVETLHNSLMAGTYKPKPYHRFMVYEPKAREISAPAFRDRVVQHAVYNVIRPIFDRCFIDQSFACRRGKGTHKAADYVQRALQLVPRDSYILQLDIRKYYHSINRDILRQLIARKIKDERLLDLIMLFADNEGETGTPIGNLLSQLFGLIYLNPIDQFVKRVLKAEHYVRYVDDFALIGLSRDQVLIHKASIVEFLKQKLQLSLSKSTIQRVTKGINFVGFRTWASKRFVRKRALYVFRRAVVKNKQDSIISCLGHARKTASLQTMLSYLREKTNGAYRQLPETIRCLHRVSARCA